MSSFSTYAVVAVGSYLLGSIPFGYLLVRTFKGSDIRQTGSGNIGATNVVRSGSKWLGLMTLLLDALKGGIAVEFGMLLFPGGTISSFYAVGAFAALCAIAGHMFPVWLRFRGGKGVATAAGAFAVLAPLSTLVCLLVFIVVVALTRFVSLGSIVGVVVFPIATWFLAPEHSLVFELLISVAALLIVVKHHQNIGRLLNGTENKFAMKMSRVPPAAEMEKRS